jgi:hypothetical protein
MPSSDPLLEKLNCLVAQLINRELENGQPMDIAGLTVANQLMDAMNVQIDKIIKEARLRG